MSHGFFGGPEHQPFTLGEGPKGVLMLHGFPGTPAELRGVAERLAAARWRVHAPLLPGFGPEIAGLGQKRWQNWADATHRAWQTLADGPERVLLGYSMGGALALRAAAEVKPAKLVLIAPFWRLGDWRAGLLPLVKHLFPTVAPFKDADFDDDAVRARFARLMPDLDLDDPNVQTRLKREIVLPTEAIDQLRRLGRAAYRAAPHVHADTLILQGEHDTTVKRESTQQLGRALAGAVTVHELGAGHNLIKPDDPAFEALVTHIQTFLEGSRLSDVS